MAPYTLNNDRMNLGILALLGFIVCAPALLNGFPFSYDIQNALVAFTHFSRQLYSGDLYPRWLYGLYNGYGAPMFYYYAPLPFYFESLIQALTFFKTSSYLVLGLSAAAMVITSAIACYFWLRDVFGSKRAFFGAAVYTILPYHIVIDLYVRGSLTELFAFTFLPLCLLFIRRAAQDKRSWFYLAFSYAGILLCSVPVSIALSPFLLLYCVFEISQAHEAKTVQKAAPFIGILCGFGLASFYLISAFLMMDYIDAANFWDGFYAPQNWFLCALCTNSPMPEFMQKITWVVGLEFIMVLALFITTYKGAEGFKTLSLFWVIIALGSIFMMSASSQILWQHIPLMQSIQFPWRLTILLDLALAYFVALKMPITWRASKKELHIPLILACIILSYSYNNIMNNSYAVSPEAGAEINAAIENGKYLPVYLPKDGDQNLDEIMADYAPKNYEIVDGGLVIKSPSKEQSEILVHQFAFPSWRAVLKMQGKDMPLETSARNGQLIVLHPGGEGDIYLSHTIMREEKIGLSISIITLILMTFAAFLMKRKGQKS